MPDLVGFILQDAQDSIQTLTGNAIIFTASVDATGAGRSQVLDANWKVCSQNVPPESTIDVGSQIEFAAVQLDETCP